MGYFSNKDLKNKEKRIKKPMKCFNHTITIGKETFFHVMGRTPTDLSELEKFANLCFKGLQSQLDWDTIYQCAKKDMEK